MIFSYSGKQGNKVGSFKKQIIAKIIVDVVFCLPLTEYICRDRFIVYRHTCIKYARIMNFILVKLFDLFQRDKRNIRLPCGKNSPPLLCKNILKIYILEQVTLHDSQRGQEIRGAFSGLRFKDDNRISINRRTVALQR